ncbi:hypothetical protein BJV77DRAFT_729468 [Russula vinacea]|nr:hypothetical protein BJV77DRAFT_729468 [Russula vinacea]
MVSLCGWEFFTTLDFEWSIIQGRRRYRWTIWIYFFSRVAALAAVIVNLVLLNLDIVTSANCKLSYTLTFLLAYLALAAASFLLMLRIVAIWKRNVFAVGIATTIWVINGAIVIQGISRLHYTRVFPSGYCTVLNIQEAKAAIIASFLTDILLLIIMLVGLFRLDSHRHGALATGRFLWNQGVISLLLAIVAGAVPMVFICINLNEPLSSIFVLPWIISRSSLLRECTAV